MNNQKTYFRSLTRIFLALILLTPIHSFAADEGLPAPELQASLEDGHKFNFDPKDNRVTIIHFWASWCEACLTELSALNDYYLKHQNNGLQVIAISMDEAKDESKARDLMKKYSFPWSLAKNTSYKKYGRIWRLPMTFIIDRKGILKKDGWKSGKPLTASDYDSVVTPLFGGATPR